jgi:hypothetical protein
VVSVFKQSGSSISNFNASVRIGSGTHTAGTITAGHLTATYSLGTEPNGVHLSGENEDSCTFDWKAPDSGVGDVKLYLAGHQGNMGGPNTDIALTASQATGVAEAGALPGPTLALRLEPTVATGHVCIRMMLPPGSQVLLRVTDRSGRIRARVNLPGIQTSERTLVWPLADAQGRKLAAGTYFVTLSGHGRTLARKLVIR